MFQGIKTSNAHDFHQKTKTLQNFANFVIFVSLFHRFIPHLILFWSKTSITDFWPRLTQKSWKSLKSKRPVLRYESDKDLRLCTKLTQKCETVSKPCENSFSGLAVTKNRSFGSLTSSCKTLKHLFSLRTVSVNVFPSSFDENACDENINFHQNYLQRKFSKHSQKPFIFLRAGKNLQHKIYPATPKHRSYFHWYPQIWGLPGNFSAELFLFTI